MLLISRYRLAQSNMLTEDELSKMLEELGRAKKQYSTAEVASLNMGRTESKATTAATARSKNTLPSIKNNSALTSQLLSSQNKTNMNNSQLLPNQSSSSGKGKVLRVG